MKKVKLVVEERFYLNNKRHSMFNNFIIDFEKYSEKDFLQRVARCLYGKNYRTRHIIAGMVIYLNKEKSPSKELCLRDCIIIKDYEKYIDIEYEREYQKYLKEIKL